MCKTVRASQPVARYRCTPRLFTINVNSVTMPPAEHGGTAPHPRRPGFLTRLAEATFGLPRIDEYPRRALRHSSLISAVSFEWRHAKQQRHPPISRFAGPVVVVHRHHANRADLLRPASFHAPTANPDYHPFRIKDDGRPWDPAQVAGRITDATTRTV